MADAQSSTLNTPSIPTPLLAGLADDDLTPNETPFDPGTKTTTIFVLCRRHILTISDSAPAGSSTGGSQRYARYVAIFTESRTNFPIAKSDEDQD